ncbi:hypothetical protein HZC07_06170 [Candidatus Micrarchaeota archaeon]|nr:hypothetical protein [Candidatus Micrarchaeota archaeon]
MEDALEICSGCGKMPRPLDSMSGNYICSRCGSHTTMQVSSEKYEETVMELDRRFQALVLKKKVDSAKHVPISKILAGSSKPKGSKAKKVKSKPTKTKKPVKKSKRK